MPPAASNLWEPSGGQGPGQLSYEETEAIVRATIGEELGRPEVLDHLNPKDFEDLVRGFQQELNTGERTLEAKDWDKLYHTKPVPIEEFLDDLYYIGEFYRENPLYDVWREEMVYVVNNGIHEWILCLQGDTPIPLLDGRTRTIRELSEEWEQGQSPPFYVYSYDDRREITVGRATHPRQTGVDRVYRVWLDDGTYVEANSRHQFVTLNGQKKRVCDLQPGDSLAPLYRGKSTTSYTPGYETVFQPKTGDYVLTHRMVGEWKYGDLKLAGDRNVLHHKDFRKENNAPDNIELARYDWHYCYHASRRGEFLRANPGQLEELSSRQSAVCKDPESPIRRAHREFVNSPEGKKVSAENLRVWNEDQANVAERRERGAAGSREFWASEASAQEREARRRRQVESNKDSRVVAKRVATRRARGSYKVRPDFIEQAKNRRADITLDRVAQAIRGGCYSVAAVAGDLGCSATRVRNVMAHEAGETSWPSYRDRVLSGNHKVLRVEDTGRVEPVYCLTVDRHHNFAVMSRRADGSVSGSGVISSNTGAIGTAKTSTATLLQMFKMQELLCMRNPCGFYGAKEIVFAMFSARKSLAEDVESRMVIQKISQSPYFRDQIGITQEVDDPRKVKSLIMNFKKGIRFAFGSRAVHALGQDVYGGILDEAAFTESPEEKQIKDLYGAVRSRIRSRFMSRKGQIPGVLCVVSSSWRKGDFMDQRVQEAKESDDRIHVSSFPVYKVKTFDGPRFRVLIGNEMHSSRLLDKVEKQPDGTFKVIPIDQDNPAPEGLRVERVPIFFYEDFKKDIERNIKDVCGISLYVSSPFFTYREKIVEAFDDERYHPFTLESPEISIDNPGLTLEKIFKHKDLFVEFDRHRRLWRPKLNPSIPRWIHFDLAKSQCSAGIACVHPCGLLPVERPDPSDVKKIVTEKLPVVYVDFVLQVKPPEGSQIDLMALGTFVFHLVKHGMLIGQVTADQYQSTALLQLMHKSGIDTAEVSTVKKPDPYFTLRSAFNAGTIRMYKYPPLHDELLNLQQVERGMKIVVDHPEGGSSDISDALAAAHFACVTSPITQKMLAELPPVREQTKIKPEPEMPDPRHPTRSATSWVYGDNRNAHRITNIEGNWNG